MELDAVDAKDMQDWNFKEAEKSSTWNGRAVKASSNDQKIDTLLASNVDFSVKAEATWEWGGSEGSKGSVGVGGSVSDDRGNSASANVQHDSDGKTSASVSVEHESNDSNKSQSS